MTIEIIEKRLEKIRSLTRDYEAAHSEEDQLYIDVLAAIASGKCEDPAGCAAAALKAQEIEFPRFCA
jgi:hypothetical protein